MVCFEKFIAYFNLYSSCLEKLPNELFPIIFSHLKLNDTFQGFFDLNQRFKSLILEFTRHITLLPTDKLDWIEKFLPSIEKTIETIKLDPSLIRNVFTYKYSYPNLRSVIICSKNRYSWLMELNVENQSPLIDIFYALEVLRVSHFDIYPHYFPKIYIEVVCAPFINIMF